MPSPTALSLTPMEKAKVVLLMSFGSPTGILRQLQDRANYLLLEMQLDAPGQKLHVINLDESMTESVVFFQNRGFTKVLKQFEMLREL